MKLLISADTHGKIPDFKENIDLILIAGDFAKGDALRKMIFEGGSPEEAKKEIIESAASFFDQLIKFGKPIVASLGNAEEFVKGDVVSLINEKGIIYKHNGIVEVNGLKILCVDFFVEKWWAEKYKPNNKETNERAVRDEEVLKKNLEEIKRVDIILTHVPPYGFLDINPNPPEYLKNYVGNMGSKILREFIEKKKPKLVVCGHIHISGEKLMGKTKIINPGEFRVVDF